MPVVSLPWYTKSTSTLWRRRSLKHNGWSARKQPCSFPWLHTTDPSQDRVLAPTLQSRNAGKGEGGESDRNGFVTRSPATFALVLLYPDLKSGPTHAVGAVTDQSDAAAADKPGPSTTTSEDKPVFGQPSGRYCTPYATLSWCRIHRRRRRTRSSRGTRIHCCESAVKCTGGDRCPVIRHL
jgi:hypothetical protein